MITKHRAQFIIIISCILFWFFASILFNPYSPFTTLVYIHSLFTQAKSVEIKGNFTAQEDNLGIIALQMKDLKESREQGLIDFSLEEKNTHSVLYESSNKIEQIYEKPFFVFGFPKIIDSKGKQYVFRLTSDDKNVKHLLELDKGNTFLSKYVYTKQSLHSVRDIVLFLVKRTKMLFLNPEAFVFSLIYFISPLLLIFLILYIRKHSIPKIRLWKIKKQKVSERKRKSQIYRITNNDKWNLPFVIKHKFVKRFSVHLFFLLFSICILLPILLEQYVVRANDLNGTDVYQIYVRTAVRAYHSFPQWNPYMQQGLPLVADPMQSMYNPLVIIPIIVMPTYDIGIKMVYVVSLFFACETMFLLIKEFTRSSKISFFIALTFATSGYSAARLVAGHIESFVPYCILPFFIFALYKTVTRKKLFWSGVLGLTCTYIFFSGSIYFLLFGFYCIVGLSLYYLFKDKRALFFIGLSLFLFLLFSSIKILPLLQLQNSLGKTREPFLGSQTLISIIRYLFVPFNTPFILAHLDAFLTPAWAELEKIAFVGIFPLIGLIWLIKNIRKIQIPQKSFLVVLFIICTLILMPGWELNPLNWVIHLVGTLQFFRVPSRAFAFLIVIVLVLFGIFMRIMMNNKKLKRFIIPVLLINLVSTTIFFEVLLIKPESIAYPIPPANSTLYEDIFSWLEGHNTKNTYVMAEISPNDVPEDIAFYHNQRLLNTNYGFILKNSPAAHFADVQRPTPFSFAYNYTDIQPGYFIDPHNQIIDIPPYAKKVYQTGDTSLYQLPDGRPFALVQRGKEAIATVSAIFGLNSFRVRAIGSDNGVLSLAEMNYPGWNVSVDGKNARLQNSRFLEVKTQPGDHVYDFSFSSKPFFLGFLISLISLTGFFLWVGITFFLKRRIFLTYF